MSTIDQDVLCNVD